ncbi:MAG TPA: hypothetical protein DD856_05990 [Sulfobacillus sp.]|nr:hypothetical protein [Sulfobacillus sp.]
MGWPLMSATLQATWKQPGNGAVFVSIDLPLRYPTPIGSKKRRKPSISPYEPGAMPFEHHGGKDIV